MFGMGGICQRCLEYAIMGACWQVVNCTYSCNSRTCYSKIYMPVHVIIGMKGIRNMTTDEIIKKVESGEIPSCEYNSFEEYVKGMES